MGEFSKFDLHAVQQIDRTIELVQYVRFGDEHLVLEPVNTPRSPRKTSIRSSTPVGKTTELAGDQEQGAGTNGTEPTENAETTLQRGSPELQVLSSALDERLRQLGEGVQPKTTKLYFAYKKLKNFATVVPGPMKGELYLYLHLDPATVTVEQVPHRDMSKTGHWGTGDLELTLKTEEQLQLIEPLLQQAYDRN